MITSKITYSPAAEINFQTAKLRKRTADAVPSATCQQVSTVQTASKPVSTTVSGKGDRLRAEIGECRVKTCIYYLPTTVQGTLQTTTPTTPYVTADKLNFSDLVHHCQDTVFKQITVSTEEASFAEAQTKGQSDSKLWYALRAGRITASKFHEAVHTNPASPSLSLLRAMCYPEQAVFTSAQTTWGLEHEAAAQEKYMGKTEDKHRNFQCWPSGFVISTEHPYIGASPDGLVSCDCHTEKGCIEVKCPYKHAASLSLLEASKDKDFCLELDEDSQMLRLKKSHKYYSQVQCQLHVTRLDFCDFIVYIPADIHIERILPDSAFWSTHIPKAQHVFQTAVLPELVACFFTRPSAERCTSAVPLSLAANDKGREQSPNTPVAENQWCYCKGEKSSTFISCADENCKIEKFHLQCLGLKTKPRGRWLCPECRKVRPKKISREKSK